MKRRRGYSPLGYAQWPERDRSAWARAVEPGSVLRPGGPASRWSEPHRVNSIRAYGQWLGWVRSRGVDLDQTAPANRVTREAVLAFIKDHADLAPWSIWTLVQRVHYVIRAMAPNHDPAWLLTVRAGLKARIRPVRDKHGRLRDLNELVALGVRLMEGAEAEPGLSARRRAVLYRDGLLIAFLAHHPIRRRNLGSLSLDDSLLPVGASWRVSFAASEMKNRQPMTFAVDASLVPWLRRYLDVHRPALLGKKSMTAGRLWVNARGAPLTAGGIADAITARTRAAFGVSVSLHLFRDCAVTHVATHAPEQIAIAAPALHQRDPRVAERYYNQAQARTAMARHHDAVARRRRRMQGDAPALPGPFLRGVRSPAPNAKHAWLRRGD